MADMTGTVRREHDGRTYAMRLTPLGIAALQDKYGNNFLGELERTEGLPNLRLFVDIVTQALLKGEAMPHDEAQSVADDLIGRDLTLPMDVVKAAFPDPESGKGTEGAKGNAKARQG